VIRKKNKRVIQVRAAEVKTITRKEVIQGTVTSASSKDTLRRTAQTPKEVVSMHSS